MARSRCVVNALSAAITAVWLTGSAVAQTPTLNMPMGGDTKAMTDEEKEQKAQREREYRDAVRKIPDQKANTDPWSNVRNSAQSTSTHQKKTGAQ